MLQTTLKSTSGNVVFVSSNLEIDTFLVAISVVSPFLANSYKRFPSFFIAINERFATNHITDEVLTKAAQKFIGEIDQKPPIFSAIKKDGKRLYELARKGETTEIATRKVSISPMNFWAAFVKTSSVI